VEYNFRKQSLAGLGETMCLTKSRSESHSVKIIVVEV